MTWLVVVAGALLAPSAFAEAPDRARAKEAYDRGVAAHERGELQNAAEEFARADALAPSPIALQAALDSAIEADDVAIGAELLERSKREPAPPGLASSITAAHLKFRGRAGRVRIRCPEGSTCMARIDDRAVEADKIAWARTGQRTVVVQVDGAAQTKLVELTSDQIVEVSLAKSGKPAVARVVSADDEGAQPTPAEPTARGEGLPPIVFYAGVGLTVVLAGATAYFAIDTSNKHESFENAGCAQANFAPCNALKEDGESGQATTNVLLALTAISGIATTVVGAAFTNWRGPLIAVHPGGGGASWRVAF